MMPLSCRPKDLIFLYQPIKNLLNELELEQHRKSLYKIHEMAGSFFHNCLTRTSLGVNGKQYFANRQINSDIITKFKLGFAPNLWVIIYLF